MVEFAVLLYICHTFVCHLFLKCSRPNEGVDVPPQPEPQVLPTVQPEPEPEPELSDPTGVQLHSTPVASPNLQIPTAGAPTTDSTAPNQQSVPQSSPLRQRVGDDLFRLVQVRSRHI